MKLLADENVDRRLIRWLRQVGHDVITGDKGVNNSKVYILSQTGHKILLTNDIDFLNIDFYPLTNTPGRIVLRVLPPTLSNQKASLEMLLRKISDKDCEARLIEVFNTGYEIHSPLEQEEPDKLAT